jgi:phage terminase small subunit
MSKDEDIKLNDKQEAFCQAYVIDYNATKAAEAAGYSKNSCRQIGSENLSKPYIRKRIDEIRSEIYKRNQISIDEVIAGLAAMFRIDISEIIDEKGEVKPFEQMRPEARACIKAIQTQTYTYDDGSESTKQKIEIFDKLGAAEKVMKHLGGYDKDNQQKNQNNITIFQLPDNGRTTPEE